MIGQQGREALGTPNDAPGHRSVPFTGFILLVFDRRPFIKSFFNTYMLVILLGYPAMIALAVSQQWKWLAIWLGLWAPAVDALRHVIPLFDNFERSLVASGYGIRIDVIHHLIAFEWIVGVPIFLFLSSIVLRLPRNDWIRFAKIVPKHWIVLMLFCGAFIFAVMAYWIFIGYGLVTSNTFYGIPVFHWHIYNFALITIGIFFACAIWSGVAVEILLGALLAQRWIGIPAKSINEPTQRNSELREPERQNDV